MANLSEILVGQGFQQAAEGIQPAVDLGMKIESTQRAREQLEINKQRAEMEAQRLGLSMLDKATKLPAQAQKSFMKNVLPKQFDKLGIPYDMDSLNLIATDPEQFQEFTSGLARAYELTRQGQPVPPDLALKVNALSNPTEMATLISDMAKGRGAQIGVESREEVARKGREQSQAQFEEKQATKETQRIEDQAKDMMKLAMKEQIPQMSKALQSLDAALGEGGIDGMAEKGRIPGVGEIGTSIKPNAMLKGKPLAIRNAALKLLNIKLKKMSGAAVTASELPRMARSLGIELTANERGDGFLGKLADGFSTPMPVEGFIRGMTDLKKEFLTEIETIKAGFKPEATALFDKRLGKQQSVFSPEATVAPENQKQARENKIIQEVINRAGGDLEKAARALSKQYNAPYEDVLRRVKGMPKKEGN